MARGSWQDRPDYVPPKWTDGKLNRWVAASPARTLVVWLLFMALSAGLVVWAVVDPHGYFDGPLAVAGLVGAVLVLLSSVVYLPRILRATRQG